jgi:hypothetical protein
MTVAFEQATIRIAKPEEFAELQSAVEQAFRIEKVERFLKHLDRKGIRVRDLDSVLASQAFEAVAGSTDDSGLSTRQLYQALPLSDQAQMREFYLSKVEKVELGLRHKFKKLYQYY